MSLNRFENVDPYIYLNASYEQFYNFVNQSSTDLTDSDTIKELYDYINLLLTILNNEMTDDDYSEVVDNLDYEDMTKSNGIIFFVGNHLSYEAKSGLPSSVVSDNFYIPQKIDWDYNITKIASVQKTVLILVENGNVYGFGKNDLGQLGLGHTNQVYEPELIYNGAINPCVNIFCNEDKSWILVNESGTYKIYGTGEGSYGSLGTGVNADVISWTECFVSQSKSANSIVSGSGDIYGVLLLENHLVYGAGLNTNGCLGLGHGSTSYTLTPTQCDISSVSGISNGFKTAIALKTDGTLWATGNNDSGQIGDGTNNDTDGLWTQVTFGGKKIKQANITKWRNNNEPSHVIALDEDGNVWCWGENNSYQCGVGNTTVDQKSPVKVYNGGDADFVFTGEQLCIMHTTNDLWYIWGDTNSITDLADYKVPTVYELSRFINFKAITPVDNGLILIPKSASVDSIRVI